MDSIKTQVLDRIANGRSWYEAKGLGPAKYHIGDKIVHLRYRAAPKADHVTYAYNINPNTLSADFEIWICGNTNTYYFIPIQIIKEIYNDPGAYVDQRHPKLRVVDINTKNHKASYSRLGNTKVLSSYFQSVMPSLVPSRSSQTGDQNTNQVKNIPKGQGEESADRLKSSYKLPPTPKAIDFNDPYGPTRSLTTSYRILRDTALARAIKTLHGYKCQICDETIHIQNNEPYAEAHHIRPLGYPHNGPDIPGNIICVCPNHHVQLDYGAITLNKTIIRTVNGHTIDDQFIDYHNTKIYNN